MSPATYPTSQASATGACCATPHWVDGRQIESHWLCIVPSIVSNRHSAYPIRDELDSMAATAARRSHPVQLVHSVPAGRGTGLPADDPYRVRRERGAVPEAGARSAEAGRGRDRQLVAAELAMAEGYPAPEQGRWSARNCAGCSPRSRRGSTSVPERKPRRRRADRRVSPRGARAAEWPSSASSSGRAIRSEGQVRGAPSVHR